MFIRPLRLLIALSLPVVGWSLPARAENGYTDALSDPGAELPVVLSAARLKQPQSEAPAAVTVLDRELIEASGLRKLVDIFRLVPGMQVGYEKGYQQSVSYHGMADENSRRLQVLVDGRTVYQPFLARILWDDLPVDVADIERIEVIRGPDSALYGANSFMAVINIITRNPADTLGTEFQTTQGNRGVADYRLSHSGSRDGLDYRFSLGARSDNGFDHRADGSVYDDDSDAYLGNLDVRYALNDKDSLSLSAGYKTGPVQVSGYDTMEQTRYHDRKTRNSDLQLRWQHEQNADHSFYLQGFYSDTDIRESWHSCQPGLLLTDELASLYDTDPGYALGLLDALTSGQTPSPPPAGLDASVLSVLARAQQLGSSLSCGKANLDLRETRSDLEFQDTLRLGDALRLVTGLNLRRDMADSETYLGGKVSNSSYRAFANGEWRFADAWLLNLGATLEHDALVGGSFSPRLALNWHLDEHQSFRAIVARATRNPDLFEARTDWTFTLRDLTPPVNPGRNDGRFFLRTTTPHRLSEEHLLSRELGYYLELPEQNLEFDLKVYDDRLSDLIEGNNNFGDFIIRNNGEARLRGAEFQLSYKPTPQWRLWLTYAYIDMDELTLARNRVTAPRNSASILAQYRFANGVALSSSYYWLDDYLRAEYRQWDARLSVPIQLGDAKLKLEAIAQTRLDDNYFYDTDNNYDNDTGWYLRATLDL